MDFIPSIARPSHPRLEVPWFGPSTNPYEPAGLESWLYYPHNEGFNVQHVIEGDFNGRKWEEAAAFVQRYAYWGMILEILQIGGLLSVGKQTEEICNAEGLKSFSRCLPHILLLWHGIHNADEEIEKTRFVKISVILKRINLFYTLLCSRETSRLRSWTDPDGPPKKIQLAYGKHSHQHEDPPRWDGHFEGRTGKRTFFTDEPYSGASSLESAGHALIISIGIAGELLCAATERKYKWKMDRLKWPITLTIIRRMSLAGWCPVWFRKLRDEGSVMRAYYLSFITREPGDLHTQCCSFGCSASQVNVLEYQTKHHKEMCDCPLVSFDLSADSECAAWIRMGHTPLIVRDRGDASSISGWKLVRSHDNDGNKPEKYVAISHVWIDGTGNASGNALHACQLERFQKAANQLYEASDMDDAVAFWVDTICVPFEKGPLKMLALRRMKQIYQNADKVLVFDAGLQKTSLHNSAREFLTRIEISAWNERLWTIQEAAFARALHFQFEDGIAGLQSLILRYRCERFWHLASLRYAEENQNELARVPLLAFVLDVHLQPVLKDKDIPFSRPDGAPDDKWLALDSEALGTISETEMVGMWLDSIFLGTVVAVSNFFSTLKQPLEQSENYQVKWTSLEKALPYRQTSITSDEGLCLSTLLGMNVVSLDDLSDEERVRSMFLHIGTINAGILFGERPRLEQPGYRWMPSSFVGQRIEISENTAVITKMGIEAKLSGLIVKFPTRGFLVGHRINDDRTFGFARLSDDDPEAPETLVASNFPVRDSETGALYTVQLILPAGAAGLSTSGSTVTIVLEKQLPEEDPNGPAPGIRQSPVEQVLAEWKVMGKKDLIQAFLVDDIFLDEDHYIMKAAYSIPATLELVMDPTPKQVEMAATATQLIDVDWLIT